MENEKLIISTLFEIKEKMGSLESKVESIHEQTLKTNGRVTKNEGDISDLKRFNTTLKAQAGVIAVILGFAGGLLKGYISKWFS